MNSKQLGDAFRQARVLVAIKPSDAAKVITGHAGISRSTRFFYRLLKLLPGATAAADDSACTMILDRALEDDGFCRDAVAHGWLEVR